MWAKQISVRNPHNQIAKKEFVSRGTRVFPPFMLSSDKNANKALHSLTCFGFSCLSENSMK